MSYHCFELEVKEGVAHLRLNRAEEFNSMIPQFWQELPVALADLDGSEGTRVIVISSAGKHFSSGMDLSVFKDSQSLNTKTAVDRERLRRLVLKLQNCFSCLERSRVPVIAAIQGACIGAAVDMITACDMRYATSSAYFCIQEINLAMMADLGTLQRLPRLIPDGIARELAFTGDRLPADRAKALGLVNEVFDDDEEMMRHVMDVARRIGARSPLAVAASKAAINFSRDHSVDDSLRQAADLQAGIFDTSQIQECMKAKSEKREPAFPNLHPDTVRI